MRVRQSFRNTRARLTIFAVVLALGVAAYSGFNDNPGGDVTRENLSDTQVVARGQEIYTANCAACHGTRLEGQPNWRVRNANGRLPAPPHDASGHTWHHDDQTLFDLTKFGLSKLIGSPVATDMPVYEGRLTDKEIWAVLAFIKSQWPDTIRQRQSSLAPR
ncbi:MAG: cytochrome c [Alphaproteobacteria bacterium]